MAVRNSSICVSTGPRSVTFSPDNYNCGSCGYAGCKGLAEAIIAGKETSLKKCKPGKEDANFKPIIEYLDQHPNEDGSKVKVTL